MIFSVFETCTRFETVKKAKEGQLVGGSVKYITDGSCIGRNGRRGVKKKKIKTQG